MNYAIRTTDELYHHGILGQKWGVRRYQNEDGTLTDLGKKRLKKDEYDSYVREKMSKTTNREEATKALRSESRDLGEGYERRSMTRAGKSIAAGLLTTIGGIGMFVGGGATGNLALAGAGMSTLYGGGVANIIVSAVAKGKDTMQYLEKSNVLSKYYDEYNITQETKRTLNL